MSAGRWGCVPLDGESSRVAGLSQCTPHFSFGLAKRETGRARSKEKKRFRAQRPAARRGSANRCKRRFCLAFGHATIFCEGRYCCPVADGADLVGVQERIWAASLLLSRAAALPVFPSPVFHWFLPPRVPLARKGHAASVSVRAANGCAVATRYRGSRGGLCQQMATGVP